MKLKIDDNYQITSDSLQYMLQEKKVVNESKYENKIGTEYYESIAFYGRIESCLKQYKELMIRKSDVDTVAQLITLIRELDKKIDALLEVK